jgi:hypothetical protein
MIIDPVESLLSAARFERDRARRITAGTVAPSDATAYYSAVLSAILLSFASMEAFLNREAERYLASQLANPSPNQEKSLKEKKRLSLQRKIADWTPIITGQNFDPSGVILQQVISVTNHRHAIVHLKQGQHKLLSSALSQKSADDAVTCAKAVLVEWYKCAGYSAPTWVTDP